MPVVNPTPPPAPASVSPFAFLVSMFQWMGQNWLIVGGVALAVFVIYILYRLFIKQKEEEDIFLRDYKRTKEMCKLQANRRRIRSSPIPIYIFGIFFFLGIGMLIVGVAINAGDFFVWGFGIFGLGIFVTALIQWLGIFTRRDKVYIVSGRNSRWLGDYAGECVTENWKNFLIQKGFAIGKQEFVVRASLEKTIKVKVPVSKGTGKAQKTKTEIQTIELTDEPIIEGEDSIIIKGFGLQQFKYFLYPILQDASGNPLSMKFVATTLEKDIALVDTLYDQTQDFARIMREQVNINPDVRYQQKTRGESGATE